MFEQVNAPFQEYTGTFGQEGCRVVEGPERSLNPASEDEREHHGDVLPGTGIC